MTIIVSVKINDGVVLATDSAATFGNGQIYLNAEKVLNLVKGLPVGIMVTGQGGIGSESINTILKDFRSELSKPENRFGFDRSNYTIEGLARTLALYLGEKELKEVWMLLRIAGYGTASILPEVFDVVVNDGTALPSLVQPEQEAGIRWAGEFEPLERLILGMAPKLTDALMELDARVDESTTPTILKHCAVGLFHPAMPIQDAIDLAEYLVDVTVGFVRFAVTRQPKTVGGPIEVATVTKHEGFRWVQRKHFFSPALNP